MCEGKENVETLALIDSGAGGKFINQNFAKKEQLETKDLEKPLVVYNVDGTLNKTGTIRKYVDFPMIINGKKTMERLLVTGLGKLKIILGFPWLSEQNPVIDWKLSTVSVMPFKYHKDIIKHLRPEFVVPSSFRQ